MGIFSCKSIMVHESHDWQLSREQFFFSNRRKYLPWHNPWTDMMKLLLDGFSPMLKYMGLKGYQKILTGGTVRAGLLSRFSIPTHHHEFTRGWTKNGRTASLALITKMYCTNFGVNWMSSKGTRAASVLSTQSCFTSFENWYKVFDGLDGVKGPLLACMTHMNHEMHMHLCFLASQVYLCSTLLTAIWILI